MNERTTDSLTRVVFWLASIAGLWLLFNLVAMPLAWGGVKASDGVLGAIQMAILLGFVLILFFDIITLFWLARQTRVQGGRVGLTGVHILGLLALVGLMGAKVMVDEIARETPTGGAGGEWGMLYGLLILQLSYVLVILFRTKPESR